MPELGLDLTGVPRLRTPDGRWHALERHDAALLALLALDGRTARMQLATWLWPDRPPARSRNSLRQRLFKLRRIAGASFIEGDESLWLAPAVVIEGLSADASAVGAGSGALELLAGCDFSDMPAMDDWLAQARPRWQAARTEAGRRQADALEREGRIDEALALAQGLLAGEPLDEAAHRRLIRLHYLAGDRLAALAAFQHCRQVLAEELDVEPERETCELARLVERSTPPETSTRLPLTLARTPSLVGRGAVLQELAGAWARRRIVLLGGEAGIGKSRLAREFVQSRAGILASGARPGDTALPYATLVRLIGALRTRWGQCFSRADIGPELARLLPAFGTPPLATADTERLLQAWTGALQDWVAQGLEGLLIDDLQFADAASVEALVHGLEDARLVGLPHLLIARSGHWPKALQRWRELCAGDRVLVLDLPALDADGVAALLDSLELGGPAEPGWADRLLRHTGGNPLFLLETLIACHQAGARPWRAPATGPLPAPEGVARLIGQRLRQLSPSALNLARMLAIAGDESDPELLGQALGRDVLDLVDDWRALQQHHVADDRGFAHDLVHAAVLREVPQAIAQVLHGRVGRARRALGHAPARVAQHLWEAGLWGEAATQLLLAAERAGSQSRRDEEIALLTQAIEALERDGALRPAFRARLRRMERMIMNGSLQDASAEITLQLVRPPTEADCVALQMLAAKAAMAGADATRGEQAARLALQGAEALHDADAQFAARQLLASALAANGQAGEALAHLEAMQAAAARRTDRRERCEYLGSLGYVLAVSGRRREAVAHLEEAGQLAVALGEHSEAMTLWSNQAGTLAQMGRLAEAVQVACQARQLSVHAGPKQGIAVASNEAMLGLFLTAQGRYDEAEQILLDALQRFKAGGAAIWIYATAGMLANLYVQLGQVARARRVMGESATAPAGLAAARRARRLVVQARLERATGRDGLPVLQEAMALMDASPQRSMDHIGTTLAWAQAAPPEAVCERLARTLAACEEQQLDGMALSTRLRLAEALHRLGHPVQAAQAARAAARSAGGGCHPYDIAPPEFWWVLFQIFEAAAAPAEANTALARAAAWLRTALPTVPTAYQDAFVHRQPLHARILAEAARRLPDWLPITPR